MFVVQVYVVTGGEGDWPPQALTSTETLIAGWHNAGAGWQYAGALPSARIFLSGVTIDNQFYVLGECWL